MTQAQDLEPGTNVSGSDSTARKVRDYSHTAPYYDQTRNLPYDILIECYCRLEDAGILNPGDNILDAGCGTAQLTMPLIKRGYEVTGIDVSEAMLDVATSKLSPNDSATFRVGDILATGFDDGQFDITAASKLFQHVSPWQGAVDEILRITKPGGYILHINEKGAFKNNVRKRFTEIAKQRGSYVPYQGVVERSELGAYLVEKGALLVDLALPTFTWQKSITYGDALEHLRLRLHSEFEDIPEPEYQELLTLTQQWIDQQPAGAATVEQMTPYLVVDIFKLG